LAPIFPQSLRLANNRLSSHDVFVQRKPERYQSLAAVCILATQPIFFKLACPRY